MTFTIFEYFKVPFIIFLLIIFLCIFIPLANMNRSNLGKCKKSNFYVSPFNGKYLFVTKGMYDTVTTDMGNYFNVFIPNKNLYSLTDETVVILDNPKNNNYIFVNCTPTIKCLQLNVAYPDGSTELSQNFNVLPNNIVEDFFNVPFPNTVDFVLFITVQEGTCPLSTPTNNSLSEKSEKSFKNALEIINLRYRK